MTRVEYLKSIGFKKREIERLNLRNIIRLPNGWACRVSRKDSYACTSFNDVEYRSSLISLFAAIEFRDSLVKRKITNNSGYKGIFLGINDKGNPKINIKIGNLEKTYGISKRGYLRTLIEAIKYSNKEPSVDNILNCETYLIGMKYLKNNLPENEYSALVTRDRIFINVNSRVTINKKVVHIKNIFKGCDYDK